MYTYTHFLNIFKGKLNNSLSIIFINFFLRINIFYDFLWTKDIYFYTIAIILEPKGKIIFFFL